MGKLEFLLTKIVQYGVENHDSFLLDLIKEWAKECDYDCTEFMENVYVKLFLKNIPKD